MNNARDGRVVRGGGSESSADGGHPLSFVVFANAKSGTTWAQRVLNDHPGTACGESRAFGLHFDAGWKMAPQQPIEQFAMFLSRYAMEPVPEMQRAEAREDLVREVVLASHRVIARASGKGVFGEKVTPYPGTAQHVVDRLRGYNPGLRFVHLVRDGRDVAVSAWVHATWAKATATPDDPAVKARVEMVEAGRIDDEAVGSILTRWVETVRAGRSAAAVFDRYLELRYEDLVEDAIGGYRRLFEFIGAWDDDATALAAIEANRFEKLSGGRRSGDEDRGSFFRKGEAGDWKNWFTPEQEKLAVQIAGDLLSERAGV